ncbi:uncharacterized protein LOC117640295 [Thrips palmi]|uniref:Uncharacterized protein LOC117640295 n=1 Tax=Thrips palmi TaxID=161013 RepID=A0A6P8YF99_THRPL|nr:uncharacterized protein LOC117640295 [Thrips palmi]
MDNTNPSHAQWTALMDFLEPDEEMLGGIVLQPRGLNYLKQRWETLAILLNATEGATCVKTGPEWKNAWNNLKCRSRRIYRDKVRHLALAGQPFPPPEGVNGLNEIGVRAIQISGGVTMALKCLGPLPAQIDQLVQQVAEAPAQVAQAAEAAHAAPPAQPAEAAHPAPPVQPPHAGQAAQAAPLPEAGQAAPPVQPPEAGQAVQAAQPPQPAQVAQAAQPVAFVVLDDEALLGEAAGPVAGVEPDLVPFKWENEDDNDVLFLDLVTPVKNEVEVKLEPVKAQIKEEGGIGGMYHTPPRDSGLTPSCKRRLLRGHARDEGFWAQPGTGHLAESRLDALIRDNTNVMQELLKVMQSINLKF